VKTLAIINQKGGVGKTTTAVTLAHGLARCGCCVLLVDLDAQGNVADALGLEKGEALYRLLIENAGRRAIVPSGRERLSVVVGGKRTVEAKQVLAGQSFREYALKNALAKLGDYDLCILDVAPGVDLLQIGALVAATHFLIPVALDHLAVIGAGDALASVAALKQVGALEAQFLGVLPTMWERTTKESHEQLMTLAEQFQALVWPPIPRDVKAREAPAFGKTLWEYAPLSTRALAGVLVDAGPALGGYSQVMTRLIREVL
jgi:chromosome partitioning protein